MRMRYLALTLVLAAAVTLPGPAAADTGSGKAVHEYGEMVDYPMLFPVADGASYTYFSDTFWAARTDGIHHATDIMAPKMTPVIAPNDGRIGYVNWSSSTTEEFPNPERCCNLTIDFDDGWSAWFIHLNNDTPGTDDGKAWGIAPGIRPGVRVTAGQLVGWVGDSGNAENTGPHLHFELRDPQGTIVNPYEALKAAPRMAMDLTCLGRQVTIRGTDGDDVLTGTDADDVIHGLAGNDTIEGGGGDDVICGGAGRDTLDGGDGDDILAGSGGRDALSGGSGSDTLYGGTGNDKAYGDQGNDRLQGSIGNDFLAGGSGNDTLVPGDGNDRVFGGAGRDLFMAGPGDNTMWGSTGEDRVNYRDAPAGAAVDLVAETARGAGTDTLHDIERVDGSRFADLLIGNDASNVLLGRAGDDTLVGGGGDDYLMGGVGHDEIDGGAGSDYCAQGATVNCEPVPS